MDIMILILHLFYPFVFLFLVGLFGVGGYVDEWECCMIENIWVSVSQ